MFLSYSYSLSSRDFVVSGDALIAAFAGIRTCPLQFSQPHLNMADILYILTSIGFFALMIAFIWGCEKV